MITDGLNDNNETIFDYIKKIKESKKYEIKNKDNSTIETMLNNQHTLNEDNNQKLINDNYDSDLFKYNNSNKSLSSDVTDPDLNITYEIIKLPSNGIYYENGLNEIKLEYMTSKDEDILTTPSLIEKGTVLDILLKRKIKNNINVSDLLQGDKNALILFLRTSSYGHEYDAEVIDPRNNTSFKTTINLLNIKYKEISELPDENGYHTVYIPMRKKTIKYKLLTSGEDNIIYEKSINLKNLYNEEYSQYNTLRLKSSIVSIDDNYDRNYINKFVDAMPALDAYTIRHSINNVSPDLDLNYEFITKDGFKFTSKLNLGIDFFFPKI